MNFRKLHTRRERAQAHSTWRTQADPRRLDRHPCLNPSLLVMPRTTPQHTALPSHVSHSVDPSLVLVLRRPIPYPHWPIPHPRPHRPTSINPSLVWTNPYLQIKFYRLKNHRQTQIGALLSRSRHRWSSSSTPNTDWSLDPISTSLDIPCSFPQSLTLSSSPSLFDRVWKFNDFILIFVSLKILHLAIFYYKFVWKLRKWLRKCEKPIENLYFSKCYQTLENIF